ncbi:uncharacterized protein LOC127103096 [Lathyrus oleraceus]|uniref:uncharacterized protein LOC127103096 n=1 Tax=Pisum sativum TaxID=3888 RepID=UPI0021D0ADEE|nr:uncharacterized protein LOC127103096 [Pisum sativum]
MSQPSVLTPNKHTKEQSNPKNVDTEVNLFDVITDVVPLSIVPVHATPIRKDRTSASRKGNPSKVSTSSSPSMTTKKVKTLEPSTAVKKFHSMTSLYLDPISVEPNVGVYKECLVIPNVMEDVEASKTSNRPRSVTTLSKFIMIVADINDVDKNICVLISRVLDNEGSEVITGDLDDKDENSVEKKDQSTDIVNIEDLDSDDVPICQSLALGIAKKLKNKKGQDIESSNMPSKSLRKRASVVHTKRWIKDIISAARKQAFEKKIPANIPEVPNDNISFHFVENVEKWKFVYQRRLALGRELGKYAFECKEATSLTQEAGLMKTVTGFGKCYEMLVKEFIVNISNECDNKRSKEFRKVEITAKQLKEWPMKGKLSTSALSVKYVVLHKIGAANWVPTNHTYNIAIGLGKFIYIVGTKSSFDFGSYIFDQTMKYDASYAMNMPIVFPSLIHGVILSQHPSILISSDSIYKGDPPLSLHYKVFNGKHVPDIVMTSGHTSSWPTIRTYILAELKDTCKTLGETIKSCTKRKRKIEMLIKVLSEEEGTLKGVGIGEEEEN